MKNHLFSFLFVILITILNFDSYQNSTLFSKTFIFSIFSIFFGFSIIWKFINNKNKLSISIIDVFIIIIFIFIILNNLNSENPIFSLHFYDLFSLFLFYLFIRTFLKTKKQLLFIVLGISVGIFVNTLYGFGQYFVLFKSFHSKFSVTGTFFNPAPFSGLISIGNILILFIILFKEKIYALFNSSKNKKILKNLILYGSIFVFSSNLILLIILKSRASILSLFVGSLFLIFIKLKSKIVSIIPKRIFISLAFSLILSCSFLLYSLRKNSADGRILIWKTSLEMIKNQPFIGVGLDKFKTYYMLYQANYFSKNKIPQEIVLADNVVYAFNDFLQILIEQGFIGFSLFIFLIFLALKKIKKRIPFKVLGGSLIISLCTFACFSYPLQILPLKIIGIFGFAICSLGSENKRKLIPNKFLSFLFLLGLFCFSILQISAVYKLEKNYSLWKKATNSYFSNDFKKSVEFFEKAYPFLKTDGEFLMHYAKALSINEQPKKSNEILHQAENYLNNTIIQITQGDNYKTLKDYHQAEKHYKIAFDMIPNRLYPIYLLAKMYEEKGDLDQAKKQAKILLEMPIKVPSMAIFQMQKEMDNLLER